MMDVASQMDPWPTKYMAIYVPEKAIKQEGQFLYFILS